MFGSILSFAGGLLGDRADRKTNQQNVQFTREQNQIDRDRADTAIRRRVKDARAAGIHPLATMGLPTYESTGRIPSSTATGSVAGDALQAVGAHITRKQAAKRAAEDRQLQRDLTKARINTENAKAKALEAEATSRTMIAAGARGGRTVDDDAFTQRNKVIQERFKDGKGNVGSLPVGPDVSEIIGGLMATLAAKVNKDKRAAGSSNRSSRRNQRGGR